VVIVGLEDAGVASSEGRAWRVGPDAEVSNGVYTGGSFEGIVKEFIPG
jgi:hypothetical protein